MDRLAISKAVAVASTPAELGSAYPPHVKGRIQIEALRLLGDDLRLRLLHHRGVESNKDGSQFAYRTGKNGKLESICTKCFVTVSHTWGLFALTPDELREVESTHICESKR